MNLTFSDDGAVSTQRILESGQAVIIKAMNLRRERGSIYGMVGLSLDGYTLSYDDFKLANQDDRKRLAKTAFEHLGETAQVAYPLNILAHDLDLFCLGAPITWEESRFQEETPDLDEAIAPLGHIVKPWLLEGGGTMIFSPPGAGKSWVAYIMAVCIGAGIKKFWPTVQRPVYLINLERYGLSVRRRLQWISKILGVHGTTHNITILNGRGQSLVAVQRKAKKFMVAHPNAVLILDSISRAGMGSMVEDDTANRIVDMLNNLSPIWLALGHTPRKDSDHQFGSTMFDAGEDIGVKLTSSTKEHSLGIALEIKKANDIPFGEPYFLALDFSEDKDGNSMLVNIRATVESEFPKLTGNKPEDLDDIVIGYFYDIGKPATATEIAQTLSVNRGQVSALLKNDKRFRRVGRDGHGILYELFPERD